MFWTDYSGNRLAEAGVEDSTNCNAVMDPGSSSGGTAAFQISKLGNTLSSNDAIDFVNGIAKVPYTVNDTGTYSCKVNVSVNQNTGLCDLNVVLVPSAASQAKLPGFGMMQFFLAALMVWGYYITRRTHEKR